MTSLRRRITTVLATAIALALVCFAGEAQAADPIDLGTAADYGVLAGGAVPNTGLSVVHGKLGALGSITGFPPGIINGARHDHDAAAIAAHADLADAYAAVAAQPVSRPAITGNLGGQTLGPGVHASGATIAVTGTLTLDAGGDPSAIFVLRAGSTLDSAAASEVVLVGDAQACNVFWQIGAATTLAATSKFAGTILGSTAITLGAGMTIAGRALARDGAVTMDSTTITVPSCVGGPLSNTAPAIEPFSAQLTGLTQTVQVAVGPWSVTDPTRSDDGYSVTVAASIPRVDGLVARAGTGGSLTLTPAAATAAAGNPAPAGPLARAAQQLSTTAATIANAPPGTGQGQWNFAADSGLTKSLAVVIPGDASAGAYSSTLTFTTAPPAG